MAKRRQTFERAARKRKAAQRAKAAAKREQKAQNQKSGATAPGAETPRGS